MRETLRYRPIIANILRQAIKPFGLNQFLLQDGRVLLVALSNILLKVRNVSYSNFWLVFDALHTHKVLFEISNAYVVTHDWSNDKACLSSTWQSCSTGPV